MAMNLSFIEMSPESFLFLSPLRPIQAKHVIRTGFLFFFFTSCCFGVALFFSSHLLLQQKQLSCFY